MVNIATGIGPACWNRRFDVSDFGRIRIEESRRSNDGGEKKEIVVELKGGRSVKFGSMLRDERRRFLASAADRMIRGQIGSPTLRQHGA